MHKRDISKLSVLVVDDSEPMQKLLQVLLTSYGATEVTQAGNGAEALAILKEKSFDLIVTDLAMRPMDGMEFSRHLRTPGSLVSPDVPVLMITAHSDLPTIKAALDAGVTEFLVKPITSGSLYVQLDKALQSASPAISAQDYNGPNRRRLSDKAPSPDRRKADAAGGDS